MKRYVMISYPLSEEAPVFQGNPHVRIEAVHSLDKGDSCNTFLVTTFNHNGTHVDFPRHYHRYGRCLMDFPIGELVFEHPYLVELPKNENELVTAHELQSGVIPMDTDLLLIRTGFFARRGQPSYHSCPVLTTETARFLRSEFPSLRCIGIDYISVSNLHERETGEEVHRILLADEPGGKPILIIEDLDLSERDIISQFTRVFVVPLYIVGIDSFLCTVFGEYDNGR